MENSFGFVARGNVQREDVSLLLSVETRFFRTLANLTHLTDFNEFVTKHKRDSPITTRER